MTIVTMTREMGTLGKDVAAGLADELNLDVVHSEIIADKVSKRLGIKESAAYRHLEGHPTQWDRWQVGKRRFLQGTEKELIELALQDDVIIRGWGAAQLFNTVSDIACVRVCAPMEFRINEMTGRLNAVAEEASAPANRVSNFISSTLFVSGEHVRGEIERSDAEHAQFVTRTYATDWREPVHYDLVLNTGRTTISECVAQLVHLLKTPRFKNSEGARAALEKRLAELD